MSDHSLRFPKDFDVSIRLAGSYVMWKDRPLYTVEPINSSDFYPAVAGVVPVVEMVNGKYKSLQSKHVIVNPNDDDFDTRPVILGWTSTIHTNQKAAHTHYIMRKPQRSQRAGLHVNNCLSISATTGEAEPNSIMNSNLVMFTSMMGLYESDLDVSKELLTSLKKGSVALSPRIALRGINNKDDVKFALVYYKYFTVGVLNLTNNQFHRQKNLEAKINSNVDEFVSQYKLKEKS